MASIHIRNDDVSKGYRVFDHTFYQNVEETIRDDERRLTFKQFNGCVTITDDWGNVVGQKAFGFRFVEPPRGITLKTKPKYEYYGEIYNP